MLTARDQQPGVVPESVPVGTNVRLWLIVCPGGPGARSQVSPGKMLGSRSHLGRHACATRTSAPRLSCPPICRTRRIILQSAPKTGQHTAEAELVTEALSHFFDGNLKCTTTPTSGGVNNVVQYVETSSGERYILRIYNNGNKSDKVKFEHAILHQLQDQQLSFQVPRVLPSKDGQPHVLLSSGAECCIFHLIPGALAKTTSPEEVGRATGELCTAMGKVSVDMEPPIAPYFDLFQVHHAIGSPQVFYDEIASNPAWDVSREPIEFLVQEIRAMEPKLGQLKHLGLPMQLIHGDLHYDNVMVVDDEVSGLLDFEFCAYDLRAMELAVALSKYVGEAEPLQLCESFVSGYMQHGQLTSAEVELIPDLVNLRIFSNVVYFTGRAMAKEDSTDSLTSRAAAYAKRVRWVNANRQAIRKVIESKMSVLA